MNWLDIINLNLFVNQFSVVESGTADRVWYLFYFKKTHLKCQLFKDIFHLAGQNQIQVWNTLKRIRLVKEQGRIVLCKAENMVVVRGGGGLPMIFIDFKGTGPLN